jgi:hypothetical protein
LRDVVACTLGLGLCAATWLVQVRAPRFEPIGAELLADPGFERGLDAWRVRARGTGEVTVEDRAATLRVSGCVPASRPCEARIEQVIPYSGTTPVQIVGDLDPADPSSGTMWLMVIDRDAFGRALSPDWVMAERFDVLRTSGWTPHRVVLRPHPGTASITVRAVRIGREGDVRVRDPSLRPVRERALYRDLTVALLVAWTLFFGAIAAVTATAAPRRGMHAATIALAVGILAALMAPMSDIATTEAETLAAREGPPTLVGSAIPSPGKPWIHAARWLRATFGSDDLNHAGLFLALALAAAVSWPRADRPRLCLRLVAFAAATEVLQLFTSDRSPGLTDVGVDGVGVALGLGLAVAGRALRRAIAAR